MLDKLEPNKVDSIQKGDARTEKRVFVLCSILEKQGPKKGQKVCDLPGSNGRPLDLQSNALPVECINVKMPSLGGG